MDNGSWNISPKMIIPAFFLLYERFGSNYQVYSSVIGKIEYKIEIEYTLKEQMRRMLPVKSTFNVDRKDNFLFVFERKENFDTMSLIYQGKWKNVP